MTPSRSRACIRPRRSVTCSKLPAGIWRTRAARGRRSRSPRRTQGGSGPKLQDAKGSRAALKPTAAKTHSSRAECQPWPAPSRTISGGVTERPGQQLGREPAAAEAAATVERGDEDAGRAEQHRVDGVEVELRRLEHLLEGPAVVARAAAGEAVGQVLGRVVGTGDEELHLAAEQDG